MPVDVQDVSVDTTDVIVDPTTDVPVDMNSSEDMPMDSIEGSQFAPKKSNLKRKVNNTARITRKRKKIGSWSKVLNADNPLS